MASLWESMFVSVGRFWVPVERLFKSKTDSKQEAIKTARQAVTLGGPFVEQYRQTLDDFQEDEPYISD